MRMRTKARILVGTALLLAFLVGGVLGAYLKPTLANAWSTPATTEATAAAPPRVVRRPVVVNERPVVRRKRSWEREALIIAGSSGAGAAIGAAAGGKKGGAVGALSGGIAGLVYDLATRNR